MSVALRLGRALERRALPALELGARAWEPSLSRSLPLRSPAGHSLPCHLHTPTRPGPWSAVLLLPGGLDGLSGVEGAGAVLSAQALARAGLAALVFSPSGREDAPGREDFNGALHQAEAAAALALLLSHPEVRGVMVLSLSFGGVMAAGALGAHPELAAGVREWIDWEGPPSRGWFPRGFFGAPTGEDFWREREAVHLISGLQCPYRRLQSSWDHVHGPRTGLGLEMVDAALRGGAPRVRLNDQELPISGAPDWAPPSTWAQRRLLLRWLRVGLGTDAASG